MPRGGNALRRWAAGGALAVVLAIVPRVLPDYYLHIFNVGLVYVIMVVGLNFVLGWTGLITLAHAGFMGIGAYTSALLAVDLKWNFWLTMPLGGVAAVFFSLIVGVPTLRLKSHYFAMATLGLGQIVQIVLQNWKQVTHGADGVVGIPSPRLGPISFAREPEYAYLLMLAAAILVFVAWRIRCSKYGRGMLAVRQAELAALAVGVNTTRTKLLAFCLSAFYAGIAGSLYAHLFQFISPDVFGLPLTVIAYAGLVIGGAGTIAGSVLGAVVIAFLPEWLRFLDRLYMLVYGLGLLLALVLMPYGFVPLARRLWSTRGWRSPRPTVLAPGSRIP